MTRLSLILLASTLLIPSAWGIEDGGGFNTNEPTDSQIPHWSTGWSAAGITGWDYVGAVGSASGVYLGNGWVMTAGHVGIGNFVTPSGTYSAIAGSARTLSNSDGTTPDLLMFQIATSPNLPVLRLSTSLPVAFSAREAGSSAAMLGVGGGQGLSWGLNTVTEINESVTPDGYSYVSNDFLTDNGTTTYGNKSITNNSMVVVGDSGGGDFTFNTATADWELTGINEVTGSYTDSDVTFSGMVQLDTYAPQINAIVASTAPIDTPTLPWPGLLTLGGLFLWMASQSLRASSAAVSRL